MLDYQKAFIDFAVKKQVLKFGQFTLKSGRLSPYFFNAGLFNSSSALAELGNFYAQALIASQIQYDLLFGPAYKGIPLVSSLAVNLAQNYATDKPYAFNRKEAKDHGEGGNIVGAPLEGRVLIVDDVITAGTAIREVIDIIQNAGATPAGVLIALDRQERGQGALSAIQEVELQFEIPVHAIIKLEQVLEYLATDSRFESYHAGVLAYREQFGI